MTESSLFALVPPPWPRWWHLHRVSAAVRSCSPVRVYRRIVAGWRFVTPGELSPIHAIVAFLLYSLYLIVALYLLFGPNVGTLQRSRFTAWFTDHPFLAALGLLPVVFVLDQFLAFLLWALVNTLLFFVRLVSLPIQMISGMHAEWLAGRRAVDRFFATLSPWLDTRAVLWTYAYATHSLGPLGWDSLTRLALIERMLETRYELLHEMLPRSAWGDLASCHLGAAAEAALLRHGLQDEATAGAILGALAAHGSFSDPVHTPVLVRELAALQAPALARALDDICQLDGAVPHLPIRNIFATAQRLDTFVTDRFVEAIGLVSVDVCLAALASAPVSSDSNPLSALNGRFQ